MKRYNQDEWAASLVRVGRSHLVPQPLWLWQTHHRRHICREDLAAGRIPKGGKGLRRLRRDNDDDDDDYGSAYGDGGVRTSGTAMTRQR
jgi:hypothetical protein